MDEEDTSSSPDNSGDNTLQTVGNVLSLAGAAVDLVQSQNAPVSYNSIPIPSTVPTPSVAASNPFKGVFTWFETGSNWIWAVLGTLVLGGGAYLVFRKK